MIIKLDKIVSTETIKPTDTIKTIKIAIMSDKEKEWITEHLQQCFASYLADDRPGYRR